MSLEVQNQSFGFRQQYLALGSSQLHFSVSRCISLTFQRPSNHVECRVWVDHILVVSDCFWKTRWAVANILDRSVHWIGMTSQGWHYAAIIADHDTTVPIIFSGIFGVG